MKYIAPLAIAILVTLGGCSSKKKSVSLNDYHIEFLVYRLSAYDSMLTCEATFQNGGKNNRASALPTDYTVELDGVSLQADSDEFPAYSVQKHERNFAGKHTWVIKKKSEIILQKAITYEPLKLISPIPPVIKKEDLHLLFENTSDSILVECYFSKDEMNHSYYPIKNNKATIPEVKLASLKRELQTLYLTAIYKSPLFYDGKETGIAEVHYPLFIGEVTIE